MLRYFRTLFLFFCISALLCTAAGAIEGEKPMLTIGLSPANGLLEQAKLENDGDAGYTLGYFDDRTFVGVEEVDTDVLTIEVDGTGLAVYDTDSGKVLYTTDESSLAVQPNSELTWHKGYRYYGDFDFRIKDGQVEVVNFVPLETYLLGVLPNEMSPSSEMEALKAQAICARSLAVVSAGKHASDGYDLCSTTNCQVYRVSSYDASRSNLAVEQTAGQVLYYKGNAVSGFYSSSNGGASESAVNVWGGDYGYLTGKFDPYDNTENAYNGIWSQTLSTADIKTRLEEAGYDAVSNVGNVYVSQRTPTGNVNEITVVYTNGQLQKISRANCRTVFGLNSLHYTINGITDGMPTATATTPTTSASYYTLDGSNERQSLTLAAGLYERNNGIFTLIEGSISASDLLVSSDVLIPCAATTAPSNGQFTFAGEGWGHQVGMSQNGAMHMAELGFSCTEILQFYFTDITIGAIH